MLYGTGLTVPLNGFYLHLLLTWSSPVSHGRLDTKESGLPPKSVYWSLMSKLDELLLKEHFFV